MADEGSGKKGLKPNEEEDQWVMCPFNIAHVVKSKDVEIHVDICRNNYVKEATVNGRNVEYVPCHFNNSHKVLGREQAWHQERCPNRENRTHMMDHTYSFADHSRRGSRLRQELGESTNWMDSLEHGISSLSLSQPAQQGKIYRSKVCQQASPSCTPYAVNNRREFRQFNVFDDQGWDCPHPPQRSRPSNNLHFLELTDEVGLGIPIQQSQTQGQDPSADQEIPSGLLASTLGITAYDENEDSLSPSPASADIPGSGSQPCVKGDIDITAVITWRPASEPSDYDGDISDL